LRLKLPQRAEDKLENPPTVVLCVIDSIFRQKTAT
jgi:hypothetical protein